ncbi:uncharacterized protein BXZ73DRAFT_98149 [Epithele typhae]|uniref:uncharacterized protein n=1 Tax=Epithele typhae TaxID=378194 RepID=UPI0020088481|nr:uncharacterized protein BXZ73DRAFT_98149 [Epithele typhae]KAH9941759.1 hypothetical protein BXZ73DRAFT_98149 [Epithele typhae]
MPDWNSVEELTLDGAIFLKVMHALAGLYFWEVVTSLDYDWSFLTGKRRFHYPAVFYFLNRYCLLFTMIGILIALDTTVEINCQSLYTFNQIMGQAASGLASINLSIRTIALWSHDKRIIVPLVIIILGHWSLILQGVLLTAIWVPGQGCVVSGTNNTILAATFIYSMAFDLVVLLLSMYKLVLGVRGGRSQLMSLLFKDGLVYFFIAFFSNLLAVVFILLNLNAIMSVIFNVPAAIFSTIVACRAVRRLTNFANKGPEVFVSTGNSFRAAPMGTTPTVPVGSRGTMKSNKGEGVHVQMQTFTMADDHLSEYDAGQKTQIPDLETGDVEISREFKRPPY